MTQAISFPALEIAQVLARQFARRADEADRLAKLPAADIEALKKSGYLVLNVPKQYGGAGLPMRDCIAAQIELAQGSGSSALVMAMQLQVFGVAQDNQSWANEVKWRFSRAAVKGGLFNSVATEPRMGSPSRGLRFATTVEPSGEDFIVEGRKTWVTGGRHLTHMLVGAMLGEKPVTVLIEGDRSGIEWDESSWGDGLSLRASDSYDVHFNQVRIPRENLIEQPDSDQPKINGWFPMVLGATYLGIAIAARNAVIQYALERVPTALGKPIATLPQIQRRIGEMDIALQAAQTLMLAASAEWDGTNFPRVAAAKYVAVEAANEVTSKALQVAGGTSLTRKLPLERYFRDVRAGLMQPPAGDTALEIVGQEAIGPIEENND